MTFNFPNTAPTGRGFGDITMGLSLLCLAAGFGDTPEPVATLTDFAAGATITIAGTTVTVPYSGGYGASRGQLDEGTI